MSLKESSSIPQIEITKPFSHAAIGGRTLYSCIFCSFFLSLIRHQCLLQYSLAQAEIIKIRKHHNRLGMYSRVPE